MEVSSSSSGYEELHRLNPYRANRPDALILAQQHPEIFEQYFKEIGAAAPLPLTRVDWTSGSFASAVTRALLLHDFGIHCELPADRLCPPVPNRLNYICWLREVLHGGPPEQLLPLPIPLPDNHSTAADATVVLDIGVGSSCIYPLLGRRLYGWSFICSDIDETNVRNAATNAKLNVHFMGDEGVLMTLVPSSEALQQLLVQRFATPLKAGGEISSLAAIMTSSVQCRGPVRQALFALGIHRDCVVALEAAALSSLSSSSTDAEDEPPLLHAAMTNPPFYSSEAEVGRSARSVCTGATGEMVTEGGELAFVLAMVVDSLVLRRRCQWYSCMIGIKANLLVLQRVLRSERLLGTAALPRVRSVRFTQGVTMRWGLAWSWVEEAPRGAVYAFEVPAVVLTQMATPEELSANGSSEAALLHGRISAALADPSVARACLCGPFVVDEEGEEQGFSSACRWGEEAFSIRTAPMGAAWEVRLARPGVAALGERLRNEVMRDNRKWRRKRQREDISYT